MAAYLPRPKFKPDTVVINKLSVEPWTGGLVLGLFCRSLAWLYQSAMHQLTVVDPQLTLNDFFLIQPTRCVVAYGPADLKILKEAPNVLREGFR